MFSTIVWVSKLLANKILFAISGYAFANQATPFAGKAMTTLLLQTIASSVL